MILKILRFPNESDIQTNSDNSDNNDTGTESSGFVISAISGITDETGTTATFTIKLKTKPLANVSISVSSSDATEGSVSPSSLLFTSGNWNVIKQSLLLV